MFSLKAKNSPHSLCPMRAKRTEQTKAAKNQQRKSMLAVTFRCFHRHRHRGRSSGTIKGPESEKKLNHHSSWRWNEDAEIHKWKWRRSKSCCSSFNSTFTSYPSTFLNRQSGYCTKERQRRTSLLPGSQYRSHLATVWDLLYIFMFCTCFLFKSTEAKC